MTNDKSNKPNDDVIICTDELRELVMIRRFNFSPDEVWVDAWTGGSMMKPYGLRWILER